MEEFERKWVGLLKDCELNLDDFDLDSSYEFMIFSNYLVFEFLLWLVLDVFVKCYNVIDMVKDWLNLVKLIYRDRFLLKSRVKE